MLLDRRTIEGRLIPMSNEVAETILRAMLKHGQDLVREPYVFMPPDDELLLGTVTTTDKNRYITYRNLFRMSRKLSCSQVKKVIRAATECDAYDVGYGTESEYDPDFMVIANVSIDARELKADHEAIVKLGYVTYALTDSSVLPERYSDGIAAEYLDNVFASVEYTDIYAEGIMSYDLVHAIMDADLYEPMVPHGDKWYEPPVVKGIGQYIPKMKDELEYAEETELAYEIFGWDEDWMTTSVAYLLWHIKDAWKRKELELNFESELMPKSFALAHAQMSFV